jgi:CelD/BcsL family acetyltransferase involved in cellulose biosynthesis
VSARVEDLSSVETEWELLATETHAAPWLRPGWFTAWRNAFAAGEELVPVCARDRAGRLRAIGIFRSRGRRLESAANVHTPWWGIVAVDEQARAAVATAALAAARTAVALHQVREDWGDERALPKARAVRVIREQAPFVRVVSEWDSYYRAQIDRHRRKEIERCRRRLSEQGALAYEWLCPSPDELDVLLDEGFRVEQSGWKGRSRTAILSQPATAVFYRDLARWGAQRGWLRLAFLRVGGRPLAFELAFEHGGIVSVVKGGYDEAAARHGPGVVLLRELLEDAFGRGVREIDLLGGDEPYKLRWAHDTRARSTVTTFRATPAAMVAYAAARAAAGAHATARRLRRRR